MHLRRGAAVAEDGNRCGAERRHGQQTDKVSPSERALNVPGRMMVVPTVNAKKMTAKPTPHAAPSTSAARLEGARP